MRRSCWIQSIRKYVMSWSVWLTIVFMFAVSAPEHAYAEIQTTSQLQGLSQTFRGVAKTVSPAVVYISTVRTLKGGQLPFYHPFFNDEFFRRFFGIPDQEREYKQQGLGSGFIVSPDGYVLTNSHVVEKADQIKVTLGDKREFEAELIGTDPKSDVAVIKIEGDDLPVASLGDSSTIEVGDWAIAIGNPYGLSHTVTAGIISAKGRANVGIVDYEDFIQTDAAINPGNSGGPLVNINGQVIGINTAIFSRSGGYQGIGFAIPINMARSVMNSLISKGKVVRGWLGVMIQEVTPDIAKGFGLDEATGTLVGDVLEGGPAEKAGIKRGDVIITFDGKPIDGPNTLKNLAAQTAPGERVEVAVIRNGRQKTLTVTIGEQDAEMVAGGVSASDEYGFAVQELTPEVAEKLGYEDEQGVIISRVEPGSPAAAAGLRRGDLIQEVNRQEITSLSDFRKALSMSKKKESVLFLIRRDQNTFYAVLGAK